MLEILKKGNRTNVKQFTEKAFDDFAGSGADVKANKKMLGIS